MYVEVASTVSDWSDALFKELNAASSYLLFLAFFSSLELDHSIVGN
jgi:hypothetical protein